MAETVTSGRGDAVGAGGGRPGHRSSGRRTFSPARLSPARLSPGQLTLPGFRPLEPGCHFPVNSVHPLHKFLFSLRSPESAATVERPPTGTSVKGLRLIEPGLS